MFQAGQAIDAVTADNDLAVVVDDYGIMSPILLYFMHLKGWSFDPGDISPEVIDNLRRLGARYFVTTQWSNLARVRPEATAFLERYEMVTVPGAPRTPSCATCAARGSRLSARHSPPSCGPTDSSPPDTACSSRRGPPRPNRARSVVPMLS